MSVPKLKCELRKKILLIDTCMKEISKHSQVLWK